MEDGAEYNFLKAKILFQEREKCEKMGMDIDENGEIVVYMGDINAMMIKDGSSSLFVFLNGIDIELTVDDRIETKKRWVALKNKINAK